MYRPFRLNREYVYVEEVPEGTGLLGSKYNKKTDKTDSNDALGYSAKVNTGSMYLFTDLELKYTRLGLVAGNKDEYAARIDKKFSRSCSGIIKYTYRKPLLGPVPLLYEGTDTNRGPAFLEPRGPDSPFWVGYHYMWSNREADFITFNFTYDPTPGTWFYTYQPDNIQEWNLNPGENARFSFAAAYTLTKFYTGTDRLVYYSGDGEMLWDGAGSAGAWATNDYLGEFSFISKFNLDAWKIVWDFAAGESLATGSAAYTEETDSLKPITGYFTSGIKVRKGRYLTHFRYSQDIWGPEEWQRDFGNTYDKLYQFHLSRDFADYLNAGVEYTKTMETDGKYYAVELGDYDEVRVFCTLSFGPVIPYFGAREPQLTGKYGARPEKDHTLPKVYMTIKERVFSPDGDGKNDELRIRLKAKDASGILRWKVVIKDRQLKSVKTFQGSEEPPFYIKWDGTNELKKRVEKGKYKVFFSVVDNAFNTSKTKEAEITVK
jgi:hypothetical protein